MTDRATVVAKRLGGLSTVATLVSVLLYGVCLAAPAVRMSPDGNVPGYVALMVGYGFILAGVPAWLANPLLLAAWMSNAFSRYSAGLTLALMSLVMALSFLILDTPSDARTVLPGGRVERMWAESFSNSGASSPGGLGARTVSPVAGAERTGSSFERMLGYYLWVASILFAACAAAFAKASIRHQGASSLLHHPRG
jgi:hypothetical protein